MNNQEGWTLKINCTSKDGTGVYIVLIQLGLLVPEPNMATVEAGSNPKVLSMHEVSAVKVPDQSVTMCIK